MKLETNLTVGQLKKYIEDHNLPDDTPVGIYIGDYEHGADAQGIIIDTRDEEIDDDTMEPILTEESGHHCYCKDYCPAEEMDEERILMITDGCHYE